MATKKIRIAELAKELGWTNKETLDRSKEMGIDVKNVSSSMEEAQADRVRRKAVKEGLVRDVQPAEEKPAKKAPAKKAAAPAKKATSTKRSPNEINLPGGPATSFEAAISHAATMTKPAKTDRPTQVP